MNQHLIQGEDSNVSEISQRAYASYITNAPTHVVHHASGQGYEDGAQNGINPKTPPMIQAPTSAMNRERHHNQHVPWFRRCEGCTGSETETPDAAALGSP